MYEPSGIWKKSEEELIELAIALLRRKYHERQAAGLEAFRARYPNVPERMLFTAAHHVFGDGPEDVVRWLADGEMFLRDPEHRLDHGVTHGLLYHIYNWHQFAALLPEGKSMVLELLEELKEFADEGALDAVKYHAQQLKDMFEGTQNWPDFDKR